MKRAAVIGLGDISPAHLSAIANNPGITLCAACDIDPALAKNLPEGTPFYTDYRTMAAEQAPDCVHICLPHYLHYPVARYFIEQGVNVLCEKPVALNAAQGAEFVALEAAHPEVHAGICLQNRFNATTVKLRALIQSGEYGAVVGTRGLVPWARPRSYYEAKPWRGKWETAGGGCMINQSVHTLDLQYYLGGPIAALHASVSQLLDYGIEVEDTVTARLEYANGAKGLFCATNANYANQGVQIAVKLERGEFLIDSGVLYQINDDRSRTELCTDVARAGSKFYYGSSHIQLIDGFYRALEEGTQDYIHVRDALMSIRLIDAIQESGRTHSRVTL